MRKINTNVVVALLCLLPAFIVPIYLTGDAYLFVFVFLGFTAFGVGYLFARQLNQFDGRTEGQAKALRLIAQSIGDLVLIHRMEDHSNVYVSPSVQNVLGYEQDFILKKFTTFLIHPDDRQLVVPRLKMESLQKDPEFQLAVRVRMMDGNYKLMLLNGKGVADDYTGIVAYTILSFSETTGALVEDRIGWKKKNETVNIVKAKKNE